MFKKEGKFGKVVLILLLVFITVLTACSGDVTEVSTESENVQQEEFKNLSGDLVVHYIDVGQGDSILIQSGDQTMLVDAGNNGDGDQVLSYIRGLGIKKLDYVFGTHPHEDHIGGLDTVINGLDVGKVYMPKVTHTTKTFKDVILAIQNKGLKITTPVIGNTFNLGDAEGIILAPNGNEYKDLNNYSIVYKLKYGNTSFLFTGDAEGLSEKEMMDKGLDLSADVLKIGHHGSHSSTTKEFLQRVDPQYAVIMVGKDNDYNHPHKETMEELKERGIKVFRTDESGTIVAISDGEKITFDKKPGDYVYGSEGVDPSQNENKEDIPDGKIPVDESGNHLIKGNIKSDGEKIYHVPDGAYYDQTEAEAWFKTEEEAQQAGFRKSKR